MRASRRACSPRVGGGPRLGPARPGFGGEPPLDAAADMDEYARFAVRRLDEAGVEKAVFAGVSMGGYICFSVVRLFPERVAGLVLLDTRETADTPDARPGGV